MRIPIFLHAQQCDMVPSCALFGSVYNIKNNVFVFFWISLIIRKVSIFFLGLLVIYFLPRIGFCGPLSMFLLDYLFFLVGKRSLPTKV
jgi:hypothetical protein